MDNQNLDQTELGQQPFPQSPQKLNKKIWYSGIAIAVLVIALVLTYFFKNDRTNNNPPINNENTTTVTDTATTTTETPPPADLSKNYKQWITVNWEPKLLLQADKCAINNNDYPNDQAPQCDESIENYLAGTISSGIYAGQKIFIQQSSGLGTSFYHYVLDEATGAKTDLKQQKIGIKGVNDVPALIDFPLRAGYKLEQFGVGQRLFSETKLVKKLFTNPVLGDFYLAEDGCIVVELPDHTAFSYDLDLSFVNEKSGEINVTINGSTISEVYDFRRPTCAANCFLLIIKDESELKPQIRLKIIGKTQNGEDLYGIIDANDKVLTDIYNDPSTMAYYPESGDYKQLSENRYTYEQFLNATPLFYWKDPLDRWVEFRNRKFAVAAEMCKPVIYLYPDKPTEVEVKVSPNGGFTKTEPAYNNGWNVLAQPNGKLTDLATGKNYNYLFWEGIGLDYPRQDKGWVIKKENLKTFFDEKLAQLGLEGQEIVDFEAYWLGRLKDMPYYKISFVRQADFDNIAPLRVSGDPKTMIRVMMTASGLSRYKNIPTQQLGTTPKRHGFTVVEWGGVLF